jgi:hypothetical protein
MNMNMYEVPKQIHVHLNHVQEHENENEHEHEQECGRVVSGTAVRTALVYYVVLFAVHLLCSPLRGCI